MTQFVWVCENSSQLSCLCMRSCGRVARRRTGSWTGSAIWSRTWTSLDWELLSLSALPAARTPGETGTVRAAEGGGHRVVFARFFNFSALEICIWNYMNAPEDVYLSVMYSWLMLQPGFSRASCPVPHTLFPVGFPCSPLSCFCVSLCVYNSLSECVCVSACVTAQLKQPLQFPTHRSRQLPWLFSVAVTDSSANAKNCCTQQLPSREAGAKEWELLIKAAEFSSCYPVSQIVVTWRPWFCHCIEKDSPWSFQHTAKKAWWRKPRGELRSGIVGCRWSHLSHVSQEMYGCCLCPSVCGGYLCFFL